MGALRGVDLSLAVKRQMISVRGYNDAGDGRLGGQTALDQPGGRRRLTIPSTSSCGDHPKQFDIYRLNLMPTKA
jgi:hypothetical protein